MSSQLCSINVVSLLEKAFQAAYAAFEKEYNERRLTPVQAEDRQAAFEKQRQSLQEFAQQAEKNVASKREELFKPILDKVNQAIKNVSKANGFVMVFDSSMGTMLFADDAIDIMPLVKTALGLRN